MPDQSSNWQRMEFPVESSPHSASQPSQPMFSAHNMQMRPMALRQQGSNFQSTGSNAAYTYGAPALTRGLSANPTMMHFEAANVSARLKASLSVHIASSSTNFRFSFFISPYYKYL